MSSKPQVVVCGEALIDLTPDDGRYAAHPAMTSAAATDARTQQPGCRPRGRCD